MTTSVTTQQVLPAVEEFLNSPNRLLIDGAWVDASSGQTIASHNPATGEVIAHIAHGTAADVDRAVAAARRAFDLGPWPRMKPNERAKLLWKVSDLLEARAEEFAQLESLDNGKPSMIAQVVDVASAIEAFRYYAGWATKIEGRTVNVSMPLSPGGEFHAYTLREPVGVCGQIVPWNYPLMMAAGKLAPALAAGNTVVLKPAEQTSLTTVLLGELMCEAGFPDGVVNIVTGLGDAGAAIAAHNDVDKVAFTGSTATGKKILDAAKGNLKKVSLELGGKSPNIVFADADLDLALPGSLNAWLFNSGQTCVGGTRLLVEDTIFDEFTAAMAEAVRGLKLGAGLDPTAQVGPLISDQQLSRVTGYLEQGKASGARALTGGGRWGESGYFVEPTILVDVEPDFSVVREEIFGPVVCAQPFSAADGPGEVIATANDTEYGLAAGIWTKDLSNAHRVARQIKAGTIWVNQYLGLDMALPFGGYKQSGWGREQGSDGIDMYLQTKSVNIAL